MSGELREFSALAGRLDAVLAELSGESRARIAGLIKDGHVRVNGQVITKASGKLSGGETLTLELAPPPPCEALPEDLPLSVLWEDEHLIAVDKPWGMITHPAPGVSSGTLVNALMGRFALPEQAGHSDHGNFRPGIVHRLDKDTSGVIVVAKTLQAHARLSAAFKARETKKTYLAIALGSWAATGPAEANWPIGRHLTQRQKMTAGGVAFRDAHTRFVPLARAGEAGRQTAAFVRCHPTTGRTHQIRVHLATLGSPILGDVVYGKSSPHIERQALHAWRLEIPHPVGGGPLRFEAPVPTDLEGAWRRISGEMPPSLAD